MEENNNLHYENDRLQDRVKHLKKQWKNLIKKHKKLQNKKIATKKSEKFRKSIGIISNEAF